MDCVDSDTMEEILISSVEDYPHLYNRKDKNYMNEKLKEISWQQIATTINTDVEYAKKKWANLRDRFLRAHRHMNEPIPSGSGAVLKSANFKYYQSMIWLVPFLRKPNLVSSAQKIKRQKLPSNSSVETDTQNLENSLFIEDSNENEIPEFEVESEIMFSPSSSDQGLLSPQSGSHSEHSYGNSRPSSATGVPNDVAIYWQAYPWRLGETFCKFRALLSEMASYISVLTIVAFSTERYLSICYPLYLYTMSGLQRAVRIITCLWFISFLSALPFFIYTKVNYKEFPPGSGQYLKESAFCGMLRQPEYFPISELSFLTFFVIPMILIAFQYIMMGLKISNRSLILGQNNRGSINKDGRKSYSHKGILRMLAAVVIGFFVCWAPFHAQRLIYIYGRSSQYYVTLNEWMFYITGILYYFSSTLNPILYNVMSNRYRTAFKEILCGIDSRNKHTSHKLKSREMKALSRSNSDKNEKYSNAIAEEETSVLLADNANIIRNSHPKRGKLYYQINFDESKNKETCI